MGNPHSYTTKYVRVIDGLEAATKPLRSAKARKQAINAAASGRPRDLAQKARAAIAQRRAALLRSRSIERQGK